MPVWVKAAGKWGSIFVILALIVSLLKQVIAFIGFLTFAVKAIVVLAFIAVFIGVGIVVLRGIKKKRDDLPSV